VLRYRLCNDGDAAVGFGLPFATLVSPPGVGGGQIVLRGPDGARLPLIGGGGQQAWHGGVEVPPGECHEGAIDLCGYFAFRQEGTCTGTLALDARPLSERRRVRRYCVTSPELRFALTVTPDTP
jgi:hypothetical protein